MYHDFSFEDVLATSQKAAWQLDDVLPPGSSLDFMTDFMPDALACTAGIGSLSRAERRTLNQIRGHEYLALFGIVEEFILPFLLDHARPHLLGDDHRIRALLQFAGEEAKHIHLFKRFHQLFAETFGVECEVVGPGEAIGAEVLRHDPLSVALIILHIEWMTQSHYLDSVHDDGALDPLFKSLLRHHWIEESQHAKLDTLIVGELAGGRTPAEIDAAVGGYFEIVAFLDNGFRIQAGLNLDALERAIGRSLAPSVRDRIVAVQHQALRWTYLGSGMTHPKFAECVSAMSQAAHDRIAAAAPLYSKPKCERI